MKKVYVRVLAMFDEKGITPETIIWEDDRRFTVEKVCDVRKAASLKVGGQGIRYTVQVDGKEKFLFLEEGHWFVEAK